MQSPALVLLGPSIGWQPFWQRRNDCESESKKALAVSAARKGVNPYPALDGTVRHANSLIVPQIGC